MTRVPHGAGTELIKITPEGGLAVRFVAGEALSQGEVVTQHASTEHLVVKIAAGEDNPWGVVYEAAASGAYVWVVVAGIGYVKFDTGQTPFPSYHVYVIATGGTAGTAGASATVNTVRHWGEIGHAMEAGSGGLARCLIHFN